MKAMILKKSNLFSLIIVLLFATIFAIIDNSSVLEWLEYVLLFYIWGTTFKKSVAP